MATQCYTIGQTELTGLRTTGPVSATHESTGVRAGLSRNPAAERGTSAVGFSFFMVPID
jgi:hypothetical protein